MCFTLGVSVAMSVAGAGMTAYAFWSRSVRKTGFQYLVLFYTGMEVLQASQHAVLNRCGEPANSALTEVGFVLVVVQPLMWNAYNWHNASPPIHRPAFALAMVLSSVWMAAFTARRFVGVPSANFEIGGAAAGQAACTRKGPRDLHLYWTWPLRAQGGLEANWLFYLCAWFVPALAFDLEPHPDAWGVPRGVVQVSTLAAGLGAAAAASAAFGGTLHEVPSTWCLSSIPFMALPLGLCMARDWAAWRSGPFGPKGPEETGPLLLKT